MREIFKKGKNDWVFIIYKTKNGLWQSFDKSRNPIISYFSINKIGSKKYSNLTGISVIIGSYLFNFGKIKPPKKRE